MDFSAVQANLESLGYTVSCFDTGEDAAQHLNGQIDGKTVGFGGSVTLTQMGLYDLLASHNDVAYHHRVPEGETIHDVRMKASRAEIYLTSVNGIAETGEIINIDGICNRVSALQYGHEKVYFVVGENKLAPDYDRALYRARNIAAPMNARRLDAKTPCAVDADQCYNCKSPHRICRSLSVLWGPPMTGNFEVVLIHAHLGF